MEIIDSIVLVLSSNVVVFVSLRVVVRVTAVADFVASTRVRVAVVVVVRVGLVAVVGRIVEAVVVADHRVGLLIVGYWRDRVAAVRINWVVALLGRIGRVRIVVGLSRILGRVNCCSS